MHAHINPPWPEPLQTRKIRSREAQESGSDIKRPVNSTDTLCWTVYYDTFDLSLTCIPTLPVCCASLDIAQNAKSPYLGGKNVQMSGSQGRDPRVK
jgi:hypothetical protein